MTNYNKIILLLSFNILFDTLIFLVSSTDRTGFFELSADCSIFGGSLFVFGNNPSDNTQCGICNGGISTNTGCINGNTHPICYDLEYNEGAQLVFPLCPCIGATGSCTLSLTDYYRSNNNNYCHSCPNNEACTVDANALTYSCVCDSTNDAKYSFRWVSTTLLPNSYQCVVCDCNSNALDCLPFNNDVNSLTAMKDRLLQLCPALNDCPQPSDWDIQYSSYCICPRCRPTTTMDPTITTSTAMDTTSTTTKTTTLCTECLDFVSNGCYDQSSNTLPPVNNDCRLCFCGPNTNQRQCIDPRNTDLTLSEYTLAVNYVLQNCGNDIPNHCPNPVDWEWNNNNCVCPVCRATTTTLPPDTTSTTKIETTNADTTTSTKIETTNADTTTTTKIETTNADTTTTTKIETTTTTTMSMCNNECLDFSNNNCNDGISPIINTKCNLCYCDPITHLRVCIDPRITDLTLINGATNYILQHCSGDLSNNCPTSNHWIWDMNKCECPKCETPEPTTTTTTTPSPTFIQTVGCTLNNNCFNADLSNINNIICGNNALQDCQICQCINNQLICNILGHDLDPKQLSSDIELLIKTTCSLQCNKESWNWLGVNPNNNRCYCPVCMTTTTTTMAPDTTHMDTTNAETTKMDTTHTETTNDMTTTTTKMDTTHSDTTKIEFETTTNTNDMTTTTTMEPNENDCKEGRIKYRYFLQTANADEKWKYGLCKYCYCNDGHWECDTFWSNSKKIGLMSRRACHYQCSTTDIGGYLDIYNHCRCPYYNTNNLYQYCTMNDNTDPINDDEKDSVQNNRRDDINDNVKNEEIDKQSNEPTNDIYIKLEGCFYVYYLFDSKDGCYNSIYETLKYLFKLQNIDITTNNFFRRYFYYQISTKYSNDNSVDSTPNQGYDNFGPITMKSSLNGFYICFSITLHASNSDNLQILDVYNAIKKISNFQVGFAQQMQSFIFTNSNGFGKIELSGSLAFTLINSDGTTSKTLEITANCVKENGADIACKSNTSHAYQSIYNVNYYNIIYIQIIGLIMVVYYSILF